MTAQWRRKFGIGLMIATASASLLMQGRVQANPSLPFTLNFEEGNLQGWQQTGTAFANQPTLGDNPTARNRGQASQHQGQYWIGGYENYQGRPGQRPGAVQGDRPQGTLTSARFRIPSGTLSFLVGGGSSPQTRVELVVSGQPQLMASGQNSETMQRVTWDLTPYAGRAGVIRIVDESSSGWGHINVDDFRFSQRLTDSPQVDSPQTTQNLSGQWRGNDGGTYYLNQIGNTLWWYGESGDGGSTWTNVFHGTIQGNRVVGEWSDVPKGRINQSGDMELQIDSAGRLSATRKTGGFGGSVWTR
ncbi:hypothetical protein [Adonisia turfae]|uniref:Uncharacterized protein n=1 Tax=Adonisia turfae CCMR0081 TaxID=2292702 RepID=A0A6M0RE45_9CYAN|nr:hypothetical protein [Adonisia turfae]NEZ54534.1 hypothetical protein [Adonisia turfae CCMR0081]